MENQEDTLDPRESLRVIRETIDLAKRNMQENGFHFLLWGWLVVLASGMEYYLRTVVESEMYYIGWFGMVVIGLPVALIYEARRERRKVEANIVRRWYGMVWLAFGISLFAGLYVSLAQGISPIPIVLILAGNATFISGILLRYRLLIAGAVPLWVGAIVCMFVEPGAEALVEAVAIVLGYLVPGHTLYAQHRRKNV